MRTLATVTFVRNAAKYIIPHLKMYKGLKNYVFVMDDVPKNWSVHYPEEPDNTLELVQSNFPEIEIKHIKGDDYNGDFINRARGMIDEDLMLFLHADVIFSEKDIERLLTYLCTTDYDCYKLDMRKCMVSYYHDFDHGVRDCEDTDPIALSKEARFRSHYWNDVDPNDVDLIDWPDFTAHHFNGWKGAPATKAWINNEIGTDSHVYAKDLEARYGGWLKCPDEIKNKFN